MSRKATPDQLVQNAAWSAESRVYRLAHAESERDARRQMQALQDSIAELERRVLARLAARRPEPSEAGGGE